MHSHHDEGLFEMRDAAPVVSQGVTTIESSGLMAEELVDIDHRIRIPMANTIDSLNVATSAAVVLYEAMRQRMKR